MGFNPDRQGGWDSWNTSQKEKTKKTVLPETGAEEELENTEDKERLLSFSFSNENFGSVDIEGSMIDKFLKWLDSGETMPDKVFDKLGNGVKTGLQVLKNLFDPNLFSGKEREEMRQKHREFLRLYPNNLNTGS